MTKVALALTLMAPGIVDGQQEPLEKVVMTFYGPGVCWDTLCTTRSGLSAHIVYPETAACGRRFRMGDLVRIVELDRTVWCVDTGRLDEHGVDLDVFEYQPPLGRFEVVVERVGWRQWW